MQSDAWERLSDLFLKALDLPEEERATWLDRTCGGDEALRAELRAMLAAHETAALEADAHFLLPSLGAAGPSLRVGDLVGPHRLEELLGRGGMGEVYRAVRSDDQFHQEVAIKVVRPERASAELTRRFLQERRIMAKLEHPGIATLLDGGIAPAGQPYLVMQYVRGQPITRWADERRLAVTARLRLFLKVCDAVQFAHGHLVVHRDLKPSNILVGEDGQPRLLDFGIAKLIDPDAAASTTGDLVLLTPEHAAPEQFLGNPVTTATDVYALGVLLYQLLTGTRPFQNVPAPELARAVCDQTPRPPSAHRPVDPDLDQIVMMALRKEPHRRYASAGQMAEDVSRFLGGWPVTARPDTAGYRVRRFVGRNRVGVAAAALLAATLVGATTVTAWQANRRAVALRQAEAERARANRITEFLLGIFRATNPNETRGRTVTARELLDQAAIRARRDLARDPKALADMELAIGRAYAYIGSVAAADSFLTSAVQARRRADPPAPLDLAEALEWHGRVLMTRGRLDEGTELIQEVLTIRERALGPEAQALAAPLQRLGMAQLQRDPYDTSGTVRAYYDRALALLRAADPPDHRAVADLLRQIASVTMDQDKPEETLALMRESVATALRATDADDPFVFNLRETLAIALRINGFTDSAIAIHRELLEARKRVFGPEHMDVTFSLYNLGRELGRVNRFQEAIASLQECLAMRQRLVGPDHYQVAYATGALARATERSGDVGAGIALFQRAADIASRALGPANATTIEYEEAMAVLQVRAGKRDAALATLDALVAKGYRDLGQEEYAPLADDPRFQRLRRKAGA